MARDELVNEGEGKRVLRWLNEGDARTRKRHQATLAHYEAMSEEEQVKALRRNIRYLRTSFQTMESMASSAVHASKPGSPQWREACASRDRARRSKEILEEALREWDRIERKDALRLLEGLAEDAGAGPDDDLK